MIIAQSAGPNFIESVPEHIGHVLQSFLASPLWTVLLVFSLAMGAAAFMRGGGRLAEMLVRSFVGLFVIGASAQLVSFASGEPAPTLSLSIDWTTLGHWGLGFGAIIAGCLALFGIAALVSHARRSAPTVQLVARLTKQSGLAALVSWLEMTSIELPLPPAAKQLMQAVREHLRALTQLELADDSSITQAITKLIGTELADLLKRWAGVAAARRVLSASSTAGDDHLVSGLARVAQQLVRRRKALLDEALKPLAVEARYLETKYDPGTLN